jgi:hypothetical protein
MCDTAVDILRKKVAKAIETRKAYPFAGKCMMVKVDHVQEILTECYRLKEKAQAVVDSREEVHSVEHGEGYLVCGAYLDDLRAALAPEAGEGKA